jgi:GNAT superfamily N-acetyltransferase
MLTIRSFQPNDQEAVRDLFVKGQLDFAQGLEDTVQAYIRRSLADDLADIPAHYLNPPGSHFWVADQAGQIKGMVGIQREDEEVAELRRMSVASDTRRQGIGGQLLETTDAFCREQGYQRIRLTTVTQLQPAIAMYRKFGYQWTGEEQYGQLTVYHFVKELRSAD